MSRLPRPDAIAVLSAQVAALTVRVQALECAARVQSSDVEWLATIKAAILGSTFVIPDLRHHARSDDALRVAIIGMSDHAIGLRLRRLARHPVAPFLLAPVSREESGCRWRLDLQVDTGADGRMPV